MKAIMTSLFSSMEYEPISYFDMEYELISFQIMCVAHIYLKVNIILGTSEWVSDMGFTAQQHKKAISCIGVGRFRILGGQGLEYWGPMGRAKFPTGTWCRNDVDAI